MIDHGQQMNDTELTVDLLRRLGRKSLELYSLEVLLPGHGPLIRRSVSEIIEAVGVAGGPVLSLLTGRSGYGKSVAAIQLLDQWLAAGSLGLWLPARFLRDAGSVESGLDAWLHSLHPALQLDAGREAIQIAGKQGRLLICVDDINRTNEADRLLRLAIGATELHRSDLEAAEPRIGDPLSVDAIHLVVPVWPEQLSRVPPKVLNQPSVRILPIDTFLPEECSEMIRENVQGLSSVEASRYATLLNHDPFLVGLFVILAEERMDARQLRAVAEDTVHQFLDEQFREVCKAPACDLLAEELHEVLASLARDMFLRRNMRPLWSELEGWLGDGSKALRGIRLLLRQGHVCRLDIDGRLEFRHDRLRDHCLVLSITRLLRLPSQPEDIVATMGQMQLPTPPAEVIGDPYFSTLVGHALARTALPADQLARLGRSAPSALFEAIQQVGEPSNEHQHRLFSEARAWSESQSDMAPNSLLDAISWTLIETDSSYALALIDAMKPNALLMAAGLRNGSAEHGMMFLRARVRRDFEPGGSDALRDRIIEQAAHRHRGRLTQQLLKQLNRSDLTLLDAEAYLALLGHLRFPDFDKQILAILRLHQDEALAYLIWAAARCPLKDVSSVLGPLVNRLAALPIREDYTKSYSQREWMVLNISWGFRRGITSEAVAYLLDAAGKDHSVRADISLMLEGVDHPDAIEFRVRHLGDGSGLWSDVTGIGDGDLQSHSLSTQTTNRLNSLWQSSKESRKVRVYAFCLWLKTTTWKDVTYLRTIDADSPFHRYAVQQRIKLRDTFVVPELLQLLRSDDLNGWWWVLAHRVWCDELRSFTSEALGQFGHRIPTDFSGGRCDRLLHIAELLVQIPISDGEALLRQHWQHLKYSPWMIHAAFRIGTPACASLAGEALAECPVNVDIFKLAFSTVWPKENSANSISLAHLVNLEPYIHRMTDEELLFLAWESEKGIGSHSQVGGWIRKHLIPRLPAEDQVRVQVADEMLIGELNRNFHETEFDPTLRFLFRDRSGQRAVFPDRQIKLLDEWLSTHRTIRGLQVAAECLKHIGSRRDLALLGNYPIDGDTTEVNRIKQDAEYAIKKRTLI